MIVRFILPYFYVEFVPPKPTYTNLNQRAELNCIRSQNRIRTCNQGLLESPCSTIEPPDYFDKSNIKQKNETTKFILRITTTL